MLDIAAINLYYLGATMVYKLNEMNDPETEEEFQILEYDAPRRYTWTEYQNATEPAKFQVGINIIRGRRSMMLQQSDYIMTVDYFNTVKNRDEWIGYRQALRDFPEQVKTIVWIVPYKTIDFDATGFPKAPPIIKHT